MVGRPDSFMPFYIGDYLADTSHLSAAEHGAYLLLLFHYWRTSSPLIDEDSALARISRMTKAEWKSSKATIRAFFKEALINGCHVLTHTRVEKEMVKAGERYASRKAVSDAANAARQAKRQALLQGSHEGSLEHSQPQPQSSKEEVPLAKANGRSAASPDDPWVAVYAKGREVFGEGGGAIVTKFKAIFPKPNKVMATLLQCQEAINPTEYAFKVLHEKSKPGTHLATGMFP